MKHLSKFAKIFSLAILGAAVFSLSFYAAFWYGGVASLPKVSFEGVKDKVPKAFVVQSGSMEPAIKTGSIVITQASSSYSQNDVISFKSGKNIVTHRVMYRSFPEGVDSAAVYKTSGDANEDFDAFEVKGEQVIGKVVFTLPYLGYVANFAKQPYGFILLVIVPATIVIYEELKSVLSLLMKNIRDFIEKTRKKKEAKSDTKELLTKSSGGLPKASMLLPIFGAFMIYAGLATSFFSDAEKSMQNFFGAASSYGEKVASLYNSDPFTCPDGATSTDGATFGNVVMKIVGSDLKVDVSISGVTPSSSYDIWINQDPGGCPQNQPSFPAAITTDGSGNGSANGLSVPLVGGATKFWISVVGGGQVLRSIAVTLP